MSNLDLNIDNYEIDDLKELLDVDENTTIGDIKSITELAVNKFNELKNQAAAIFFREAGDKLVENFENNEPIDDFEKEEIGDAKFEDVDSRLPPPSQEVKNIPKTYNLAAAPDNLNPTMRNVYNTTANIDSQYREIYTNTFDCSGSLLIPDDDKQIIRMDSSTDYTFDLNEPLREVLSISIGSVELPLSWYNISERMGTNRFDISGIPIVIDEGFYNTIEEVIKAIQDKLDEPPNVGVWDISYNKRTGKTDISGATTTIDFVTDSSNCSIGPKINHNLGWLLGFRQPKYTLTSSTKLISESIADIYGPRYLFIKLGDFQNNRLTDRLTTLTNNNNTFKMPEYYKKYEVSRAYCKTSDSPHTMDFQYNKKHGAQTHDRPCRKGTKAGEEIVDGLNNLTNAQKYTSQQFKIESVKRQCGQNRHFAPTDCDIILRIPIDVDMTDANSRQKPYIYQHDGSFKRIYFGPTTIKRFKVELLDDKGINIDLNGLDWSFSLNVEKLRKY